MKQVYPYNTGKAPLYSKVDKRIFYPETVKTGSDCYQNQCKTPINMNNQENMTSPEVHNKLLVIKPQNMEIYDLPGKARSSHYFNLKQLSSKPIIIKLSGIKDRENSKGSKRKKDYNLQRNPH